MRTALSRLALVEPTSLRAALQLLHDDPSVTPMAGCTDLYVGLNFGTAHETRFLNLWGLDELRTIAVKPVAGPRRGLKSDVLSIGALATYTQIIRAPLVRRWIPMLCAASRETGGVQIQNRGTIGGNVANGSPAGDSLPVLAAAEATIVLRSVSGERRVPFIDYYTGYRRSIRRPDELIVAVEIPRIEGRQWFRKVGTRAAQAISKVVMAGVRHQRPRIALGSVAPTVIRLARTEAALASGASMPDAQLVMMHEIAPIDDIRSTAAYRRRVCTNLLARFWIDTTPKPRLG